MAIEIVMPKLGWTMEEGVLTEWVKKDGDPVRTGEILFTVESDKALQEVEAFDEGILRIPPDSPVPGSIVKVGGLLAYVVQPGEQAPFERADSIQPEPPPPSAPIPVSSARTVDVSPAAVPVRTQETSISPRARRIAGELAVDWSGLKGSGRSGRIVERDIRAEAAKSASENIRIASSTNATRAPLSGIRRRIADKMVSASHITAPVTLTTEVDATELVRMRAQLKADPAASQQPVPTFTDLVAKLAAHALGEHPALNGRLEGDEIVTEARVNIGIAVDSERGLLVPVVRDVQAKTLRQVAAESQRLIERTREGKLAAEEMRDGTFTITNLGMYEIDAFTPIINVPESAILGMGRIIRKAVVLDETDQTAMRHMMVLSLTFDHRLVDGAPAARFLQRIKQLIEQPYLWLIK